MKKLFLIIILSIITLMVNAQNHSSYYVKPGMPNTFSVSGISGDSIILLSQLTIINDSIIIVPLSNYTLIFPSSPTLNQIKIVKFNVPVISLHFSGGTPVPLITSAQIGFYRYKYNGHNWIRQWLNGGL